jgi:putative inorganic carbon (HCO3(-)) transporter
VAGRLLDSRLAFLAGAPVAVVVGIAASMHPFLALALVGVALLLLAMLVRAEAVLLVLVAALPWEDLLAYPTETYSAVKILGILLFGAWLVRALVRAEPVRMSPALGWAALLGFAVGLSLLLCPNPAEGIFDAMRYALFIVFFFLVLQLTHSARDVRRILRVFVLSSTLAAGWGLYGFIFTGLSRAAGPIGDANDFAYLMTCVLPLAAYLMSRERSRRVLWGLCCVLLLGATLATLSRGALVGLGALVPWAIVTRRIPLRGLVLGVAALLSVAALGFLAWAPLLNHRLEAKGNVSAQNVTSRQALWSAALRMAEDRPLTGVGPSRFGIEAPGYVRNNPVVLEKPVVHNSYLQVLAEIGLLGLLTFVGFLVSSWRLLGRSRRQAEAEDDIDGRRLATAMQASLIVAIVAGAFLSEQLTTPFWLIGALAAVVGTVPQAARAARPPHEPAWRSPAMA